jgi:hypothetical protein
MIGCASHRLNLAVNRYLGVDKDDNAKAVDKCTPEQLRRRRLLAKESSVMSKMKTTKGRWELRSFTEFVPIKANATRWSGNKMMVTRLLLFRDGLEDIVRQGTEFGKVLGAIMPSTLEFLDPAELSKTLDKFHSVSLTLQFKDGEVNLGKWV